jgi:hypothetical protein
LLSQDDMARLGVAEGKPRSPGSGAKACSFSASGKFTASVTVRPTTGLSQLNTQGMQVSPMPLGSRQAQKTLDATNGVCAIDMAVSDTSSAGVSVANATSGSAEAGCATALEVANIVEPKLP